MRNGTFFPICDSTHNWGLGKRTAAKGTSFRCRTGIPRGEIFFKGMVGPHKGQTQGKEDYANNRYGGQIRAP